VWWRGNGSVRDFLLGVFVLLFCIGLGFGSPGIWRLPGWVGVGLVMGRF
jgi:hypothetical protein